AVLGRNEARGTGTHRAQRQAGAQLTGGEAPQPSLVQLVAAAREDGEHRAEVLRPDEGRRQASAGDDLDRLEERCRTRAEPAELSRRVQSVQTCVGERVEIRSGDENRGV